MERTPSDQGVVPRPFGQGPRNVGNAAFLDFVQATKRKIFTLAKNAVHDHHAAEDLTQETLANCWRAWATFDPSKPSIPWAIKIAGNAVNAYFRSAKTQKRRPPGQGQSGGTNPTQDVQQHIDGNATQPIDAAVTAEQRLAVWAAIGQLDDDDSLLIKLHMAGSSYEEIEAVARWWRWANRGQQVLVAPTPAGWMARYLAAGGKPVDYWIVDKKT